MLKLLLNPETKEIVNAIVVDENFDPSLYSTPPVYDTEPAEGETRPEFKPLEVADDNGQNIGDIYDAKFVRPEPPAPPVETYVEKRAAEYPAIGDQLDAILKGFNQLRLAGTNLPDDLDAVLADWLAVKNKYPKPE